MAIPDFQTIMLPLLRIASDGKEHKLHNAVDQLGTEFSLTDEEMSQLLPSGTQPTFFNRVSWARTYLKKAGLFTYPKRTFFQITDRGKKVLEAGPARIDIDYLRQFEEFVAFREKRKDKEAQEEDRQLDLFLLTQQHWIHGWEVIKS